MYDDQELQRRFPGAVSRGCGMFLVFVAFEVEVEMTSRGASATGRCRSESGSCE